MEMSNTGYDAKELAPLILLAKEHAGTFDVLYYPLTVYIVRMPLELGGAPVTVCWSKPQAERMVESLKTDEFWQKELAFEKKFGLKPADNFVITETMLSSLSLIGE